MWQKGQSGNPQGRRAELTSARRLLDSRAPELIQKANDMALVEHDTAALKICLDRIMPVRRRSGIIRHPVRITACTRAMSSSSRSKNAPVK